MHDIVMLTHKVFRQRIGFEPGQCPFFSVSQSMVFFFIFVRGLAHYQNVRPFFPVAKGLPDLLLKQFQRYIFLTESELLLTFDNLVIRAESFGFQIFALDKKPF